MLLGVVEDSGDTSSAAAEVLLLVAAEGALGRELVKEAALAVAAEAVGDGGDCGDGVGRRAVPLVEDRVGALLELLPEVVLLRDDRLLVPAQAPRDLRLERQVVVQDVLGVRQHPVLTINIPPPYLEELVRAQVERVPLRVVRLYFLVVDHRDHVQLLARFEERASERDQAQQHETYEQTISSPTSNLRSPGGRRTYRRNPIAFYFSASCPAPPPFSFIPAQD